jgi:uncharacterized secreted protein with C-terminal beta-propeller domain
LNPSKPAILGELKITGFSSYLHSINDDNTLLVGVGEEADKDGMILGLKIALFDTSDPEISEAASQCDGREGPGCLVVQ